MAEWEGGSAKGPTHHPIVALGARGLTRARRWVAGITTPQGLGWKAAGPKRRSLGRRTETAQTDHQSSTPTHAGTGELEGKQAHVRRFRLVRQSQATRLRLLYHEYTSGPTWQRS